MSAVRTDAVSDSRAAESNNLAASLDTFRFAIEEVKSEALRADAIFMRTFGTLLVLAALGMIAFSVFLVPVHNVMQMHEQPLRSLFIGDNLTSAYGLEAFMYALLVVGLVFIIAGRKSANVVIPPQPKRMTDPETNRAAYDQSLTPAQLKATGIWTFFASLILLGAAYLLGQTVILAVALIGALLGGGLWVNGKFEAWRKQRAV